MKQQETGAILTNHRVSGDYRQIDLSAPSIAGEAEPGQFVHVRLPALEHRILRRPFSVFRAEAGVVSIIYKVIGEGTAHLAQLGKGAELDILGPLGVGFSIPSAESGPIIVAGGYGCAATYMLAQRSPVPCRCLLGARTAGDVLLVDEFRELGCNVSVATDDGSAGHHGLVTDLLIAALDEAGESAAVFACGPNPMLAAVSRIVLARGLDAEVSLDHVMCCGVGACFACVVKMKADTPDGWEYVRTCLHGPVFKASRIVWDG